MGHQTIIVHRRKATKLIIDEHVAKQLIARELAKQTHYSERQAGSEASRMTKSQILEKLPQMFSVTVEDNAEGREGLMLVTATKGIDLNKLFKD